MPSASQELVELLCLLWDQQEFPSRKSAFSSAMLSNPAGEVVGQLRQFLHQFHHICRYHGSKQCWLLPYLPRRPWHCHSSIMESLYVRSRTSGLESWFTHQTRFKFMNAGLDWMGGWGITPSIRLSLSIPISQHHHIILILPRNTGLNRAFLKINGLIL